MAIFLTKWALAGFWALLHPFYISMTDINYHAPTKSLEVSVRIFPDDLESALKKSCKCKVELVQPTNKAAMEKLVAGYIGKRLQIKVNGQPVALQFAGYAEEGGSIWSYFEVKDVPVLHGLEITNSLLHDYTSQQVNMLHITANGKERSEKLDYPTTTARFSW